MHSPALVAAVLVRLQRNPSGGSSRQNRDIFCPTHEIILLADVDIAATRLLAIVEDEAIFVRALSADQATTAARHLRDIVNTFEIKRDEETT